MNKEPWKVEGVPWKTEAAFWSWVRGVLRKGWSKHPVKLEYIKNHRKRITNPKADSRKRFPEVWGGECEICHKDFAQSELEVDHKGDAGTFRGLSDVEKYIAHLFLVDFESLRLVCKPCHKIVSHSQKIGSSFEEARIEKEIISLMKSKDLLDFLAKHGYSETSVSNIAKRKALVTKILKGEN
jgi:hypothetical protein